MSPTLFEQGVEIMLFGMGTVIAFLTLLVLAMGAMTWLLGQFYPTPQSPALPDSAATPEENQRVSEELLAVISAAVHRHRQQTGRKYEKEAFHD